MSDKPRPCPCGREFDSEKEASEHEDRTHHIGEYLGQRTVVKIGEILGINPYTEIERKYGDKGLISLLIRDTISISDEDNYRIFEATGFSRVLKAFGFWHLAKQDKELIGDGKFWRQSQ